MTIYNYLDYIHNEIHQFAMLKAIALLSKFEGSPQLEITLTVNGEEIDFLKFIDQFSALIDHLAKEKAQATVSDKYREYFDALDRIHYFLKDELDKMT